MNYKPNLEKGDFIAVAMTEAYIDLGWFVGFGKNSLLYYNIWSPDAYFKNMKSKNLPFTIKSIRKSYITAIYPGRVIKLTDPKGSFFKEEHHEWYKKGVEILTELNFLNK